MGSTSAILHYQSDNVPRSLRSTGRVGTYRDILGSDSRFFGVEANPTQVEVADGRGEAFTLDANGFQLESHVWNHVDYYDNDAVLNTYYAECEALVKQATGATTALAFDHNIRAKQRKSADERLHGEGGSAVQEPLITYGVHNDYTVDSAPRRIEQLSRPLRRNDTLRASRKYANGASPLAPSRVKELLQGRWVFINVWRNIA